MIFTKIRPLHIITSYKADHLEGRFLAMRTWRGKIVPLGYHFMENQIPCFSSPEKLRRFARIVGWKSYEIRVIKDGPLFRETADKTLIVLDPEVRALFRAESGPIIIAT